MLEKLIDGFTDLIIIYAMIPFIFAPVESFHFIEHELFANFFNTLLLQQQAWDWIFATMDKEFVTQIIQILSENPQLLEQDSSQSIFMFRAHKKVNMSEVLLVIQNSNTLLAHKFNWPLQYMIKICVDHLISRNQPYLFYFKFCKAFVKVCSK